MLTLLDVIALYDKIEEKRKEKRVNKATALLQAMASLELVRERCRYELSGNVSESAQMWHEILNDATKRIEELEGEFKGITHIAGFRWARRHARKP